MTVRDGAILWWSVQTWLFVAVIFIVSLLPSVTPLEDLHGACSGKFVIFCIGASEGWER